MQNILKSIKPSGIILIVSLIILLLPACQNRFSQERDGKGSENLDKDLFVVRIVSVQTGTEKKYIDHLNSMFLPVWSDLLKKGRLLETCVFQIETLDSLQTEDPPRNFLILTHLPPGTLPELLLKAEMESKNIQSPDEIFFSVIRSEVMVPTPNSYFPVTTSTGYERVEEIDFFVEFIDVNNSRKDLELYRHLMSSYFGPANGILVEENIMLNFMAFETVQVLSNNDNDASWNQIHISGDFPEYINLNWDSLYTDLFRKEFSVDLDSIWDLLPDIRELPPYYSGSFIKKLHIH